MNAGKFLLSLVGAGAVGTIGLLALSGIGGCSENPAPDAALIADVKAQLTNRLPSQVLMAPDNIGFLVNDAYETGLRLGWCVGIRGGGKGDIEMFIHAYRTKNTNAINDWFALRSNVFEILTPKP